MQRIGALVAELTLEEKVSLLTGRDFWSTVEIERIGLRSMTLSDGPSGVRGPVWDERDPSLNLPSATALSASWDRDIARRYGEVAAAEARRKGVDVVLGPTINLHRSPLGGRHFEAFSEDPILTGDLAAAYVEGVQSRGVGATPKHYVANDFETERFTASSEVSDRALRELYLLAFEKAITEAHAWAVMSAYNSINGVTASEHELLETPLNSEWGFDGVVVSDWTGVRSVEAANASQDLVMPGPVGAWGDALVEAVRAGEVQEASIDRKVARMLLLAARVGALSGFEPAVPSVPAAGDGKAFIREAEAEGIVLVRNDGILPLNGSGPRRIAVIGHSADVVRTQGGGSATVVPESIVSPLAAVRARFPDAEVVSEMGAVVQTGITEFPLEATTNPATGEPGLRVRFLAEGEELHVEDRRASVLVWFGGDAPVAASDTLEITTHYTPDVDGEVSLGIGAVGRSRMWVDGVLVIDVDLESISDELGAALLNPPVTSVPVAVKSGTPVSIRVEHTWEGGGALGGALAYQVGLEADGSAGDALIESARRAAAEADLALVVVGTNAQVESEGFDRADLKLPGRQDELVAAVAATGTPTVVAVNAGSPVETPWRDDVAAVLLAWFGGQEMGDALLDVLTGEREPGGRLPTTWPARTEDAPVLDVTPIDGKVEYTEGIHIGYRAWARQDVEPAFAFGSGLGYTSWRQSFAQPVSEFGADGAANVSVLVENTGERRGKAVVQIYASREESSIDRPARWLVAFDTVRLDAGEAREVKVVIPARAFAHWDDGWKYEPGSFSLHLGASAAVDLDTAEASLIDAGN